ncbi:MAG: helix-turn-helix transcriptional regulator [Anaerolineae bacterium]
MSLSERLRSQLGMRGVGAGWLALRTGISRRYINALIAGDRISPSLEMAASIAQALGVSLEWLAGLPPRTAGTLQPDEEYLLSLYRSIPNPDARRMFIEITKSQVKLTGGAVPAEPESSK